MAAWSAVLRTLVTAPSTHLLEHEHARVMARALGAGDTLTTALAGGPTLATVFPSNNSLADQLKMVARMVSVAQALGARRQVFLVSLGGFDTHAGQAAVHPALPCSAGWPGRCGRFMTRCRASASTARRR